MPAVFLVRITGSISGHLGDKGTQVRIKALAEAVAVASLLVCGFVGCGGGSKQIEVTSDPKEIERLRPMMPPSLKDGPGAPPGAPSPR